MLRPAALAHVQRPLAGARSATITDPHARPARLHRLVRFALTGGVAAVIQLLVLALLTGRSLPAMAANALAFLVAAQVNFWLSQSFTWRDRRGGTGARSLSGRWLHFHGAIAGTALLNMAVFGLAASRLPHLAAAALGIGVAAAANYVLGDRLVFRADSQPAALAVPDGVDGERSPLRPTMGPPAPHSIGPLPAAEGAFAQEAEQVFGPASPDGARAASRRWAWLGLAGVVGVAALLYGWGLSRNGYANEYYAAAVLSMSESWHAFFYGALDAGGFITVDKPPFAFWVQALSVRLFGMSAWSILLPQAVAALVTLLVVYAMARRQFGAPAATLAGLVLALTPITVAVARVNLPDTILITLLTLGAWATFAAVRSGRLGPLLLGMACVGLGFNTKMLQAFVVVPAFMATYLLAAPGGLLRRLAHLTLAGLVLLAVSASWMTVVDSVSPESRPYVGGSSDNTVLDLALGYNGLGRIFGQGLARGVSPADIVVRVASALLPGTGSDVADATGATGAGPSGGFPPGGPFGTGGPGGPGGGPGGFGGGPGFGGSAGWLRLFNNQVGGQIGWLLPLAFISLAAGLIARGRRPRTDGARAWYLLWGGWLVTHALVFSFAEGIFHPYYTSALAPAVAALCGPGLVTLWHGFRRSWWLAWALPAALAGTAVVAVMLVTRSEWLPWLAPAIVAAVGLGIFGLLVGRLIPRPAGRRIAAAGLAIGLAGILAGPAAWASTPVTNSGLAVNPQAGPLDSFGFGRFGAGGPGGAPFGPGRDGFQGPAAQVSDDGQPDGAPTVGAPPLMPAVPGQPMAGFGVVGQAPGPGGFGPDGGRGAGRFGPGAGFGAGPGNPPGPLPTGAGAPATSGPPGGRFGGPFGPGGRVDSALIDYLVANRGSAEYLVAVNSSMAASPIILQTGAPVMAMGGFSGGDPAPTAEQLAQMVATGKLRFVMLGGRGGGPGRGPGGGTGAERSAWIQASCIAVDPAAYGGQSDAGGQDGAGGGGFGPGGRGGAQQLYDCTPGLASTSDQPGG